MHISYKTAHYAGLAFILMIIIILGAVPLIGRKTIFRPFEITSKEMSELIEVIEIRDIFDRSREDLLDFLDGKSDDVNLDHPMDSIVGRINLLSGHVTEEEKLYLERIKKAALLIRTSFLAYKEEVRTDPTGDNTRILEKIVIDTKELVHRQIAEYISKHNISDIYEAQTVFKNTLMKGTAAIHLTSIIGIFLGLFTSFTMIRALRKPLETLVDGAKRLQQGDFSFRVNVYTQDEIGQLGNAFNNMAEELGEKTKSLEKEIAERKSKEEALKEHEEKLALAMEISQTSAWLMEYKKQSIEFSHHFFKNIGYHDKEIGKSIREFFDLVHPDDLAELKASFRRGVRMLNHVIEQEFRILTKDGEWRWFSSRARVVERDDENNPIDVIGMMMDINDKREMEVHLQRAQKMEAIGTLAGGVAHDLNNILSGIVSYPELLLLDLPPDSNMIKPIQTIRKSGEKATAIVQDLLTLARRGVVTQDIVNLNDIISAYLHSPEFSTLKSFHAKVDVTLNLDLDLMNIIGSTVHLHKTIMNLISNAVEAMPNGGIIKVSTKNTYLDTPVLGYENIKEGDYAVMRIQDSGIGIDHNDLKHIFEPFYTKKVMGRSGTGLGMPVVWGTVKDHNGYIDIKSKAKKGTEVTIYFPVTRKESGQQLSPNSAVMYRGNGEKILVVDDVIEQREIASNILNRLGYSVKTVSSGEQAVEYFKDKSVDLVVLDMIMDPGIDGLETYRKIIEISPGQKAIIASGFTETEKVKEAQRLGAGEYLKKPYSIIDIGKAVKSAFKNP